MIYMVSLKGIKKEIISDVAKIYYTRKLDATQEKLQDTIKKEKDELAILETIGNKQKIKELTSSIEKNYNYLKTIQKAKQNPHFLDGDALAIMLITGVQIGTLVGGLASTTISGAMLGGAVGSLGAYGVYKGGKYLTKKLRGWRQESARHALARRGIKTWRKKR